ncbi:MAG: hypothetical protein Q9Q13_01675 [Acidobacteriota bacterium]|nr:hypothetical protein [Acidobacteriota bacterium]
MKRAITALARPLARFPEAPPSPALCGPEGVGKRSAALGLAAGLVCRRGGIDRACGRCPPCQRVLQSRGVTALRRRSTAQDRAQVYPDIGFVGIPEGKTRISVLQARDGTFAVDAAVRTPRRIYIEPADSLTPAAANSSPAVLEEPPPWGLLDPGHRPPLAPARHRPLPDADGRFWPARPADCRVPLAVGATRPTEAAEAACHGLRATLPGPGGGSGRRGRAAGDLDGGHRETRRGRPGGGPGHRRGRGLGQRRRGRREGLPGSAGADA